MTGQLDDFGEEKSFGEFRRKVKSAEVLSASMERLLLSLRFTGKVSVCDAKRARTEIGLRGRIFPATGRCGRRRRGGVTLMKRRRRA